MEEFILLIPCTFSLPMKNLSTMDFTEKEEYLWIILRLQCSLQQMISFSGIQLLV